MKNILVTGASGFVGQQLCETLKNFNYNVYKAVRKIEINKPQDLRKIEIGKIDNNTDWSKALKNIDCVIHCAGRAHRSNEQSIKIYHETNVEGTKNLDHPNCDVWSVHLESALQESVRWVSVLLQWPL